MLVVILNVVVEQGVEVLEVLVVHKAQADLDLVQAAAAELVLMVLMEIILMVVMVEMELQTIL